MTPYLTGPDGAREDLCRYLSACYYEPTSAFAEERLFDAMQAAAGAIDPALLAVATRLARAFESADLQDLLVDYTALFIGPGQPKAMPYVSFWLSVDQSGRHEAMTSVTAFYDEGGFEVGEDMGDFPDHVAIELEFLYALSFRENEARHAEDAQSLSEVAGLRHRVLQGHVAAWLAPFAAAVRSAAHTAFYRELADLTEIFLDSERRRSKSGGPLVA